MGFASFSFHRWNVGINPDLAFASVGQDKQQPDRRVLGKFLRSQHRASLMTPPRFKVSAYSDPVKRWNFRKADWKPTYRRSQYLRRETVFLAPFTPEELAAAFQHLKPGKSPGLDSIFREIIHHAGSALEPWLCDFLTSCMRQLKIPRIWRRALRVTIPKPVKQLRDSKIYHPISLPCVPFKILDRLI